MAFGGDFAYFGLLRFEIVLSFILTLGLLGFVIHSLEALKSDAGRMGLKKNIGLFWLVLFLLFTPLVLFFVFETVALACLLAGQASSTYEDLRNLLVTVAFFVLNIGLICAIWLALRIRRTAG
ncbi:MAG TPA: hypothetical protein ENH13_03250 [Euryarchaeota archaeon]|nr:hypothetical protein BMS3Bbin16_00084 [archaeon BMS3Bbin16]HDH28129.1 hypothetical protein [Euryarchaeota archaeon]